MNETPKFKVGQRVKLLKGSTAVVTKVKPKGTFSNRSEYTYYWLILDKPFYYPADYSNSKPLIQCVRPENELEEISVDYKALLNTARTFLSSCNDHLPETGTPWRKGLTDFVKSLSEMDLTVE